MESEAPLDRIESRTAIRELVAGYCQGADDRDEALFLSVWHADAVWDVSAHRFVGRDEILEAVRRQWEFSRSMSHTTANSVVEFRSHNDAVGRHDVVSVTVMSDGEQHTTVGQYVDRYTRRDGRWAIAERTAVIDLESDEPRPDLT